MKAHIIKNGKVVNTILIDSLSEGMLDASLGGSIDDSWDGTVFTAPSRDLVKEAKEARDARNALLAETDFHALADITMSDDMKTYREALRAVPQQDNFPIDITWPEAP